MSLLKALSGTGLTINGMARSYRTDRRRITPDEVHDMTVLYGVGHGLIDIAKRYDVTNQCVRYHLLKQGVKMRPVGVRTPFALNKQRQQLRQAEVIKAEEMEHRAHQICTFCGDEYAKDRRTVICGKKRCRQQREYHNRTHDPVRRAMDLITWKARYERKKQERALSR